MFQCASGAMYPMQADVLVSTQTQDPVSGQIQNAWTLESTISCSAKSSMSRTSLGEGSFLKPNGINEYTDFVKLRTQNAIPIDRRVTNIRNTSGLIWTEGDDRSGTATPTKFEVRGISPILDTLGGVLCYEMVLARLDVQ